LEETKERAPKKKNVLAEKIHDPTQYTENRKQFIQKIRDSGENAYPHKFHRNFKNNEFHAHFAALIADKDVFLEDTSVSLAGRVMSIRAAGAKLIFIDLMGDETKVQIMASASTYKGDFDSIHSNIRRGDIIGVEGIPGRSKTGELSIRPNTIIQLSYCLHQLPTTHEVSVHSLTKDTRYRQRYLDLIMNNNVKKIFQVRN
jgi:lysyl-tRNA synthetase class 2